MGILVRSAGGTHSVVDAFLERRKLGEAGGRDA